MSFSNYVESSTAAQIPSLANTNELVPLAALTTTDFTIQNGNQLVCANAGTWQFTIIYQLYCLDDVEKAKNGTVTGWALYSTGGATPVAITNSAVTNSVTEKKGTAILTNVILQTMSVGDIISFGVRSDNQCKRCPNTVCKSYITDAGVSTLSVYIAGIQLP